MTDLSERTAVNVAQAPAIGMLARTRDCDWRRTPLGRREAWLISLRLASELMLASGHAMCLMWDPGRVFLNNDAYASLLSQRHPEALGMVAAEVWPDVWPDIEPLVQRPFAGETLAVPR